MWRLKKPDVIDLIIDKVLAKPGRLDWTGIRKELARLSIQIDRPALHRRVKKRLHLLIQKKNEK
jgi:hypothetical protein